MRTLAISGALIVLLAVSGCGEKKEPERESKPAAIAKADIEPKITVSKDTREIELMSSEKEPVMLALTVETPKLTGAGDAVEDPFAAAVKEHEKKFLTSMKEWVGKYPASGLSCPDKSMCELTATIEVPASSIEADTASVTLVTRAAPTQMPDEHASSINLDLKTGKQVKMPQEVDATSPGVIAAFDTAASKAPLCDDSKFDSKTLLKNVKAWTPSENGIMLTWDSSVDEIPIACGTPSLVLDLEAVGDQKPAEPESAKVVLPSCDTANSWANQNLKAAASLSSSDYSKFGPTVLSALESAVQSSGCQWQPSEGWAGPFEQWAAELTPAAQQQLIDGLIGFGYKEREVSGNRVFEFTADGELHTHVFIDSNRWLFMVRPAMMGLDEQVNAGIQAFS